MANARKYPIDFSAPPAVGTTLKIGRKVGEVVAVTPHARRDGAPSWLITWSIEGRRATSGLRAAGVCYERGER
ncbi:hypothetical protein LV780_03785 [Cereibacter azotoformans]|uniref:Uncharacterized protein n=1 Tax=Cereibacter azotoformans TaxID=43057 RepID=A0A2T5JWR1_9RHOB|nr:hypothetical protein [Cereibacter azotoformans]MBO4169303.1 hypothetical protein [Cereibacter azotoformans]PTR14597.1 hypothetical protein C8J28_11669 [Cereibacter azotoformans]UIJ31309.1 hypothetical protein LV780_03785 [Cereibacter azotoformans]